MTVSGEPRQKLPDKPRPKQQVVLQGAEVGEAGLNGSEKKFLQTWASWAVEQKIATLPLDLSIEADSLKNVEIFKNNCPYVMVSTRRDTNSEWTKLGETDIIRRTSCPKFVSSFQFECKDEADKQLGIRVEFFSKSKEDTDKQKFIGAADVLLKDLVDAPKQHFTASLLKDGKARGNVGFLLDAVETGAPHSANFLIMSTSHRVQNKKAFFVISKGLRQSRWTPVYVSETSTDKTCICWEKAELSKEKLVGGDAERAFKIELFIAKKTGFHVLLGSVQLTYNKFLSLKKDQRLQYLSETEGLVPGGTIVEAIDCSDTQIDVVLDILEDSQ